MNIHACCADNPVFSIRSMITGAQIRAAIALLDWNMKVLAGKSGVAWATIQRMQKSDGIPNQSASRVSAVQKALEAGGVVFIDDDGVKLRKDKPGAS